MDLQLKDSNITAPSAFSIQTSGQFELFDGRWSSFNLQVGDSSNGPQNFRVIPSTSSIGSWLPTPEGCNLTGMNLKHPYGNVADVANARGVGNIAALQSPGYQGNNSDSANSKAPEGLYTLTSGISGSGPDFDTLYGKPFAGVSGNLWEDKLHFPTSTAPSTIYNTSSFVPIFAVTSPYYWSSSFGIAHGVQQIGSPGGSNYHQLNSTLTGLANSNIIPSKSWAYTAGAYYDNQRVGSLVLGGYDQQRVNGTSTTFDMTNSALLVSVTSFGIVYNNGSGLATAGDAPFPAYIDSTLPYLFLPNSTIDWLMSKLLLSYSAATEIFYYNLNTTIANNTAEVNRTRASIDSYSISIGHADASGSTALKTISFPYAAFEADASALWNFTSDSVPTVLIRRAPSKFAVLGRPFFQEAYVSAEYEHNTFNVSQAARITSNGVQIQNIYSDYWKQQLGMNITNGTTTGHGLSGGSIAGIVIGSVVGVAAIAGLLLFLLWWKPKKTRESQEKQRIIDERNAFAAATPQLDSSTKDPRDRSHERHFSDDSVPRSELATSPSHHIRRASERSELSGDTEIDTSPHTTYPRAGLASVHEVNNEIAELEAPPAEMEGEGALPAVTQSTVTRRPVTSSPVTQSPATQSPATPR